MTSARHLARCAVALGVLTLTTGAAGCGGNAFEITSNGMPEHVAGAHSTLATQGTVRALDVCGDYPVVLFSSDTGGSVCITLQFDAAALHAPATLTVSGTTVRQFSSAAAPVANFSPDATHDAAIRTLWMHHDCDCSNPSTQRFSGTVTLDAADARHLAGTLTLDVLETDPSNPAVSDAHHVQAHFDASE